MKHLGCGRRHISGYVLVDVVDHAYIDHVSSIDNWRETEHAHIDDFSQAYISHMDKEHGVLISLHVECRRPAS